VGKEIYKKNKHVRAGMQTVYGNGDFLIKTIKIIENFTKIKNNGDKWGSSSGQIHSLSCALYAFLLACAFVPFGVPKHFLYDISPSVRISLSVRVLVTASFSVCTHKFFHHCTASLPLWIRRRRLA
jgi:hypothetical protein